MSDHIHWLLQLGSRLSLGGIIARFKFQTKSSLREQHALWQRDFYEHRLRCGESIEAYAQYVFLNPYRAKLVVSGAWPGWWSGHPHLLQFTAHLNSDGSPPIEWINHAPPERLHVGE